MLTWEHWTSVAGGAAVAILHRKMLKALEDAGHDGLVSLIKSKLRGLGHHHHERVLDKEYVPGPFVRPEAPPAFDREYVTECVRLSDPGYNPLTAPRPSRPHWDDIWMELAERLARRSTCLRASVGCVIVTLDNSSVMGIGYNGGPKGLNNDCLSDEPGRCGHLHAEINALIKTNYHDAAQKKAYLTLSPCYSCAVALVNAGISEVYFRERYRDEAGLRLLERAGVKLRILPDPGVPARDVRFDQDGEP
jgi:dCMP deaminase